MEDGQLLEDTELTNPDKPLVYMVGHYQASKCMELAVQQMHIGEVAMIHCPNDLDLGGAVQNNWHSDYGFSWVANKIDTRYKITLLDCDPNPVRFQRQDKESLKEKEPFYLLAKNTDVKGNTMALTLNATDLYAPKVTGVHNVNLEVWSGTEKPNLNQQFLYNSEEDSIRSVG